MSGVNMGYSSPIDELDYNTNTPLNPGYERIVKYVLKSDNLKKYIELSYINNMLQLKSKKDGEIISEIPFDVLERLKSVDFNPLIPSLIFEYIDGDNNTIIKEVDLSYINGDGIIIDKVIVNGNVSRTIKINLNNDTIKPNYLTFIDGKLTTSELLDDILEYKLEDVLGVNAIKIVDYDDCSLLVELLINEEETEQGNVVFEQNNNGLIGNVDFNENLDLVFDSNNNKLILYGPNATIINEVILNNGEVVNYSGGDGININNNIIDVKIDTSTQPYIKVDDNGIKIFGLDEVLSLKTNTTDFEELINRVTANENDINELSIKFNEIGVIIPSDIENRLTNLESTQIEMRENIIIINENIETINNTLFNIINRLNILEEKI